ncbi:CRISPR-associated endonuclease Cas1 [Candidatus Uhrbacteria bacterium]|nr:CRISPR-associated endonuclease Cas1 [Candidatus Uhrbacteria bacterium]
MTQSLPVLQTHYFESEKGLESARSLIDRKCRNMGHLIGSYLKYRRKTEPENGTFLEEKRRVIDKTRLELPNTASRQTTLLFEARATHAYWQAVYVLARQQDCWKRTYPHAQDPLNQLLNIGYTMLNNSIRKATIDHGLAPSIGMLHLPINGNEALVYDLTELFRQPVVDAAILPFFSRRRHPKTLTTKKIIRAILQKFERKYWYQKGWWRMDDLIVYEIVRYKSALLNHTEWIPYKHDWSHRTQK